MMRAVCQSLSIAIVGVLLLSGCGEVAADGQAASAPRATPVAAARIERDNVALHGTYVGELQSDAADLAPGLAGRLESVAVRIGDEVEAGQVLAKVDDRALRQQLAEARAQVRVAQATVERARVDAELAARELARLEPLAAKELVSARDVDAQRGRVTGLQADIGIASARVDEARARVGRLEEQIRDATLVAPFDGVVAQRFLDPGGMVQPGTVVLRVVEGGPLRVRFRVPEHEVAGLVTGLSLTVTTGGTAAAFEGHVARISGEVSRGDRAVVVEGVLSEAERRLRPGMFARVRVERQVLEAALVVPGAAVLHRTDAEGAQASGVLVVDDDVARWIPVDVLGRTSRKVAIAGDLEEGQQVLVLGHESLRDGAPVRVQSEVDG